MPNWCENEIRVVKNVENFQRFIKDFTEKGFECVMPIPREMKDPNEIVYWCSENWGTKGIGGDIIVSKNKKSIYFDTAWSPPSDQILMQISIIYGVDFRLTFFETGCAFEGMAVVKGGYITKKVFVPDYMDSRYIDEILEIEEFIILVEEVHYGIR